MLTGSERERWLTGGGYPNLLRPFRWYGLAFACTVVGIALIIGHHALGVVLGLGPAVVVVVDLIARAPRLRGEALSRLEARAPAMRAADVEEQLAFIVRYYGGRGIPSVRRRMERIRGLPRE